jgi:hypothetical protein
VRFAAAADCAQLSILACSLEFNCNLTVTEKYDCTVTVTCYAPVPTAMRCPLHARLITTSACREEPKDSLASLQLQVARGGMASSQYVYISCNATAVEMQACYRRSKLCVLNIRSTSHRIKRILL